MDKIKITPAELLSQAGELDTLEKEYDVLVSGVNSVMQQTNNNWSSNLAHNFSGKITNAQKSFKDVVDMLHQGASIAKTSAQTFESVDSLLAKNINGGNDALNKHSATDLHSNALLMSGKIKGTSSLACSFSADPVNLSNGNFVYEKDYLQIDSSLPMSFHMFYNSNSDSKGALGLGWLHNYEIRLRHESDHIVIEREDGSEQQFFSENGAFTPVNATFGALAKVTEGYLLIDDSQIRWTFDEKGCLLYLENMAGERITLEYNEQKKPIKITNEVGDHLALSYDANGYLSTVSDFSGRSIAIKVIEGKLMSVVDTTGEEIQYDYNSKGLLSQITNGRGIKTLFNEYDDENRTVSQTFADGGIVSYVYNDNERSVDMVQQNGSVITHYHDALKRNLKTVYPNGSEIFTYNKHNQLDAFTDKRGNTVFYSYDDQGNITEITNARRDVTSMTYNDHGQVLSVSLNGELQYSASYDKNQRLSEITDDLGGKTCYEYDEMGQIVSCTEPDGSTQKFEYDKYGHISTVINPMGGKVHYEYDALHRVVKTVDPLGNATVYTYDNADRLVSSTDALGYERAYTYDGSGNVTEYKDGNGAVTHTEYTVMNQPESVTDPDGNTTQFEYDLMWNLTRKINADGGEEVYTYDEMNQVISFVDAEGGENRFSYDANGNMIQRIDPEGGVHKLEYDELNRPIEITDPMGRVAKAEYNAHGGESCVTHPDGSKTEQSFDALGRVVSQTDRCGYELNFTYDAMGQITEIADKLGWKERREYYPGGLLKSVKEREGATTVYEYDACERIIGMTNESGGKWSLDYDALGRPTHIYADGKLAEAYEYDAEGNILAKLDGEGNRTAYRYSQGGNMIAMVDASGYETTFEYSCTNELIKIIQPEFKIDEINAINEENRRVRETIFLRDKRGLVIEEIDPEGNRDCYSYDKCGRLIAHTEPDGQRVDTEYYADNTVKSYRFSDGKSVMMQYDALKQLILLEDALGITRIVRDEKTGLPKTVTNCEGETVEYEWEENGNRKSIRFPDGKVQTFEYDNLGRLSTMNLNGEQVRYEYDTMGRLRQKSYPNGLSSEYEFDKMGYVRRLTHKNNSDILEQYEYSYLYPGKKSGMRRTSSQSAWSGDYTYRYDARGSLIGVLKDGKEIESYRYDNFGNRIGSTVNGQSCKYTYNRLNQLISMQDAEGMHSFDYDLRGNMIRETLNGKTLLQLQFDATGMLSSAQSDNGTAEYLYNGFGQRHAENITLGGVSSTRRFGYDITKDNRNMLFTVSANGMTNIFHDNEILGVTENNELSFFMNDALSNPVRRIQGSSVNACQYTAFGCREFDGNSDNSDWLGQSFIGYTADPITGLYHSPRREYSPKAGRFISKDSLIGTLSVPLALHAYHYCLGDSVNYWDPSGAIWAQLGAGIVGAVAKVATKAAGDIAKTVVSSVKNGKLTVECSPWQEYVGAATGGFTEGVVLSTTGNFALAGAAGAAVETVTANGLKMATGVEGYRKEDGYTLGTLAMDTAKSGVKGAVEGAVGGYLFKSAGDTVKLNGINKGKGSFLSIFKANVTKSARGHIEHMTMKSVAKGIIVFGGVGAVNGVIDGVIKGGKKEAHGWVKNKLGKVIGDKNVDRLEKLYKAWKDLGKKKKASCAATK